MARYQPTNGAKYRRPKCAAVSDEGFVFCARYLSLESLVTTLQRMKLFEQWQACPSRTSHIPQGNQPLEVGTGVAIFTSSLSVGHMCYMRGAATVLLEVLS